MKILEIFMSQFIYTFLKLMHKLKVFLGRKKTVIILLLTTLFASPMYLYAEGEIEAPNKPKITLSPNISVTEGDSGTKTVQMTIGIDKCPDTNPIIIEYYTEDKGGSSGARVSDNDYIKVDKKLLTFTKDTCTKTKTVNIKIKGDTKLEEDETFYFKIRDKGTNSAQPYTIVNNRRNITIKNDEIDKRADLRMWKWTNKGANSVSKDQKVTYTLYAKNLGPYKSRIRVEDTLPLGVSFISISDDSGNFTCNYNHGNRKITCTGSREFNKNQDVKIKVKVKTTISGPAVIKNTARVSSPDGIEDPKLSNNKSSTDIHVDIPGGYNHVRISKTVDNSTPDLGDTVLFTIKVTNRGLDRRIAFRDKFPKYNDSWGTTGGAFELISIDNPTPGVTCKIINKTSNDPYVFCYSDAPYTNNQSFTVKLSAKIKKKGRLCNRAYAYEYYWINKDTETVCLDATGNFPPTLAPIPDQWTQMGSFTMAPNEVSFYANDPDGDTLTYAATGLPAGLYIDTSTGVISGTTTTLGDFTVNITVDDGNGATASDTFIINVKNPPLKATPDFYNTKPGIPVMGNFITDNTGNGSDTGVNIQFLSHTPVSEGALSIGLDGSFTYTPESTTINAITFTYTIKDDLGAEDTATVTINIGTDYHKGSKDFKRINPPQTRNIIGDYIIMGNTITCITDKNDTYDGTCQNDKTLNNNRYMSKYIDIDNDPTTWASSSSNFTLPDNYEQQGGEGILWAALFWQGGVHNEFTNHPQRRAYSSGATFNYKNITSSQNLDLEATAGNKILFKINNESNYTPLQATSFYYDSAHGNEGGYYAAYTDITQLLKSKNLAKGNHTITIANITTNEGRDERYGNYGGWSLVIIYKQDDFDGDPRNISIYNGYLALSSVEGGISSKDIKVSGFRLPKFGPIKAKFSSFSGEGEYAYGGAGTNNHDKMIIKRTPNDSNPKDMPGAADTANIFDAKLANIQRNSGKYNAVLNTNGIDIDVYNVSHIMEEYRNLDKNISSLYIGLSTSDDYITPSMLAFSTELYQPNICYDYTQDIDGYILESKGNTIKTSFGSYGDKPLTTRISIRSKEGDFALQDVNITYRIHDNSQIKYKYNSTAIAPNDIYAYIPAGTTGLDQTYSQTTKGFSMYIGEGASKQPNGPGGVIDSYETRYFKLDHSMHSSSIDTRFDLWMEYNVDYGSGKLSLSKSFGPKSICQEESGYFPAWGNFNISSDEANVNTGEPYNLYTQVANRDFNARITSYDDNFKTPKKADTSIEVELFNAGLFSRDTNVSCNNPDANISNPIFIRFNDEVSVPLENLRYNIAIRNAGFRIWHLANEEGSVIEHKCATRTDESCFKTLYTNEYTTDTNCNTECSVGGTGCYPCLRTYYGKPICSRDNFAIRPEAFVTTLKDSNQSIDITKENISISHSRVPSNSSLTNTAKLVAGYAYRFDINATNFLNDNATPGYIQQFNSNSLTALSQMKWTPNGSTTNCNDPEDKNISITLFDGSSLNTYEKIAPIDGINQIGEYKFMIKDENWTAVDWNEALTKHHLATGFNKDSKDCKENDDSVTSVGSGKQGCTISSKHSHPNGHEYTALELRYYPYTFNIDQVGTGAGTNNTRNFVYINELNTGLYPGGRDENMSYNIYGTFKAANYTGDAVSNFVKGCYADPVDMTLYHTYLSDIPTATSNLSYDLIDYNTTNPSIITKPRTQGTITNSLIKNDKAPLKITQPISAFAKDMKGAITMDLGFNFNRTNNNPLNPRRINFSDFNISYSGSPDISVNMKTDHKIYGNKKVDQNVTFFYARAKTQQSFYDDITENSVNTPISVVIYCDLGFTECQERGIMAAFAQTSEYDWWKSWDHNSNTDGKIEIKSTPSTAPSTALSTALSTTSVTINNKGVNNTIAVSKNGSAPLPQTIPINFVTGTFPLNYTDRWLIYNANSATVPPSPFYKVRFIGNSGWAGHGETGHVVGGESNTKKSKRVEW